MEGRKGFSVFPAGIRCTQYRGEKIRLHSSVRPELRVGGAGGDFVKGGRCWILKTLLRTPWLTSQDPLLTIQGNLEHFRGKRYHQVCDLGRSFWQSSGGLMVGSDLNMRTPISRLNLVRHHASLD